jgi:hypothetical protein
MKKLIFILCLLPLGLMAQQNLNNNTVNITSRGDIYFPYAHCFMHFRDSAILITASQNAWYKVNNATNGLWNADEFDYLTKTGDTVRVDYAGDYWSMYTLRLSGTNQMDRYQLGIFKNGILQNLSSHTLAVNNGQMTLVLQWYFVGVVAGDYISLRVRNVTNGNDPTLIGGSFYMKKEMEE